MRKRQSTLLPPALIAGTGYTVLGLLRSLGSVGIPAICLDRSPSVENWSRWYRRADQIWADDSLASKLSAWKSDGVLFCCSDKSTMEATQLSNGLRETFRPIVPSAATAALFLDKGKTAVRLAELEIPHPESFDISGEAAIDAIPDMFFTNAFLKPRDSQSFFARFGVKGFLLRSKSDAASIVARIGASEHQLLLQRYIEGPPDHHFFIEGYVAKTGEIAALFARRRERMFPLDFGNSTAAVSIPLAEVRAAVASLKKLIAAVDYRGIFSAEFKDDMKGIPHLIEVNIRPWWYFEHSSLCGLPIGKVAYDDAVDQPLPAMREYVSGVRMVLFSHDRFAAKAEIAAGRLTIGGWLRSWLHSHPVLFRFSDPLPSLGAFFTRIENRMSRLFGRTGR